MTNYREMAARGREEARARTAGRRKRRAVEVRTREVPRQEWVPPSPFNAQGFWRDSLTGRGDHVHEIVGDCGHVLDWRRGAGPNPPSYWAGLVERGRRYVCGHDDCEVEPKPEVPDEERCEFVEGIDYDRRCRTHARFETEMGRACKRHRDWWLREGYIDAEGRLA